MREKLKAQSRPTRGAWIEIELGCHALVTAQSRPTRGAWIEIRKYYAENYEKLSSRPTRGAWIEILKTLKEKNK